MASNGSKSIISCLISDSSSLSKGKEGGSGTKTFDLHYDISKAEICTVKVVQKNNYSNTFGEVVVPLLSKVHSSQGFKESVDCEHGKKNPWSSLLVW